MWLEFVDTLGFALGITAPIFILVALGAFLRHVGLIDQGFVNTASNVVFVVGLPTLMFITIVKTDVSQVINFKLIGTGLILTLLMFLLLWLIAPLFVKQRTERGIFIQGSFRGNMGIVGLAFCVNAYGDRGLAAASLFLALITVLYNILAVLILTHTLSASRDQIKKTLLKSLLKNPIIIGILLGLATAFLHIKLHPILLTSIDYVADLTLPLALICIGGSLSMASIGNSSFVAMITVLMKLVVVPALMVILALPLGFTDFETGIFFLMVASPTAAASYIMVQAMKGDGVLAANIVVISTLFSVLSVSAGLVILKTLGLV